MPNFRKLTAEDLNTTHSTISGERARVRDEYRSYLRGLKPGEGGELQLADNEKKITVKNRIKRAAAELTLDIEFKRSGDDLVRFRIRD